MEIKRLSAISEEVKSFATDENLFFLPPKLPSLSTPDLIVMAGVAHGKIVGLLLGGISVYNGEIQAIFAEEEATAILLVKAFDEELKKEQCVTMTLVYKELHKSFLKACGLNAPEPLIYRYYFKPAEFNPSWFLKNYRYPSTLSPFLWAELAAPDRKEIERRESIGNFPPEISPFLKGVPIEPINSLGLKKGDEVIGWCITERLNDSTIKYAALYIEPDFKYSGAPIKLLIDSILLQKQSIQNNHPAVRAIFDLNINQTEPRWHQFIERRLSPHAVKTDLFYLTWKEIT